MSVMIRKMLPVDAAKMLAARQARAASAKNVDKLVQNRLGDLSADIQARIREKLAEMPVHHRQRYVTAMTGRSRDAAIQAQCWECLGYETHPTDCSSPACSLYPYRPGAKP